MMKIVQIKFLRSGAIGCLNRKEILTHITVHVKVFHGQRKVHSIKVSIMDKISVIIDELHKLEKD